MSLFFSAFPNAIYLFGQPIIARDMTWSRNLQAPGSLEPECLCCGGGSVGIEAPSLRWTGDG